MALRILLLASSLFGAVTASSTSAYELPVSVQGLLASSHLQQQSQAEAELVNDYEVGLGAMEKKRGQWRFKTSERFTGQLSSTTWQVVDGFDSSQVLDELQQALEAAGANQLFACDGRACGHGSQWANRVFGQRVLYGHDDLQRYRVYRLGEAGDEIIVLLYSSARTASRQYLHLVQLQLEQESAVQLQQ